MNTACISFLHACLLCPADCHENKIKVFEFMDATRSVRNLCDILRICSHAQCVCFVVFPLNFVRMEVSAICFGALSGH
ncbi:hypothetical protein HOY80DRAFT_968359 [Tuber brumale]|nr:hypothetical protein HOY80DRAFT_968359 [Tuber brumale]